MPDLPQIPGTSGAPQIPGASGYSARSGGPVPLRGSFLPSGDDGRPPRRRRKRKRWGFGKWHIAIAVIVALIGLARASPEVKTPDINVPEIKVPDFDVPTDGSSSSEGAAKVPAATVYRAATGRVTDHPSTVVELGVRNGRIRWVATTRFPTECTDGTSSSGLILYTDEGKASGTGDTMRYVDGGIRATFRQSTARGTLRYRRSGSEQVCTGSISFRTTRASEPTLAQGLLDADRRAARAFGGD